MNFSKNNFRRPSIDSNQNCSINSYRNNFGNFFHEYIQRFFSGIPPSFASKNISRIRTHISKSSCGFFSKKSSSLRSIRNSTWNFFNKISGGFFDISFRNSSNGFFRKSSRNRLKKSFKSFFTNSPRDFFQDIFQVFYLKFSQKPFSGITSGFCPRNPAGM